MYNKTPEWEKDIDAMTEGQLKEFVANENNPSEQREYAKQILKTVDELFVTLKQ